MTRGVAPGATLGVGATVATLAAVLALTQARPQLQPEPPGDTLFRDITAASGIAFTHHAAPDKKYIVESMSGGVALFDFDRDGLIDIYFVDSMTVETKDDPRAARSALYRNLGHNRFEDVTERAGVGRPGWGMGACVADIDGDGWPDLYVTALNGNTLYRNKHDGTFEDITQRAGVAAGGFSTGCGFADYDRDGDLDLFVSRYVQIDLDHLPRFGKDKTCEYRGIAVQCGPRGLPGETDFLFRNDGHGKFTDVSQEAGVSDPRAYYGLGVAWFDANDDGWPDLYVANDATPNFLYLNQRNGTFTEMAMPLGVAVSADGQEQGSMGVAIGDYDNSGRFSIFVTNFSEEYNALYHAERAAGGAGSGYVDLSWRSKTAAASLPYVGWGSSFFDYDNDGLLDLYVVNGHVYPQLDKTRLGASAGYRQRRLLYHNRGDGTFDEVAARAGPVLMDERVSRGSAIGDLDNDGRLDIVINDLDGRPHVLHNELPVTPARNWLRVVLVGTPPNTLAIGAIITVRVGDRRMMRLVQSGTSYLSQDDMRQHFGVGAATTIDDVDVRWPDGSHSVYRNLPANRSLTIERR